LLFNGLTSGENFSFSKYADGEYSILINKGITNCDNWTFEPDKHKLYRDELLSSFKYKDDGYYVGISCPCCVSNKDVLWMRENVGSTSENLTWANIFVNGNYQFFKDKFIPEFKNHDIVLFANKQAILKPLPFNVNEFIPISNTAWVDNYDLVNNFPIGQYKNKLFLFCAGPLGNMLAAKFWKYNRNNTYLDIGSTLNTWLVGANRGYLKGGETINKICTW
jgi:hypothetical protein